MLNVIDQFPNEEAAQFNTAFLNSENDIPILDLVVMCMKEFEAVENVEILSYDVTTDPDDIDVNYHSVNINYKRKTTASPLEIPKNKYLSTNRVGEVKFTIKITTNMHEKTIVKKILIPIEYDGFYTINNKNWKTYWQLVDASTYSQRGKITLKSRMPIIIYQSKKRPVLDANGEIHELSTYSYALNSKARHGSTKVRVKFINPLMIFASKIGVKKTIEFFGLKGVVEIAKNHLDDDNIYYYFFINDVMFKADRYLVDNVKFVGSFVAMLYNMQNNDFPVTYENLEDHDYWRCRIGYIGSAKSKNLLTFLEKGRTTIYMIERLLDSVTKMNLRLPEEYKQNIYYILRWMIMDFDSLKSRNNMDLNNKRIRKNEYIVMSSLGKKISENINKIIEKKSKSKLNTMDTLLEMFNFPSDIIVNGMRNIGDLVKSDELVNDFTWLQDLYYSSKGPNSLGEQSSKMISQKYRNIHPSYVGKIDINVSSNSDVGMSGAFTPFVELFDRFYFSPDPEPCDAMFNLQQEMKEYYSSPNCSVHGMDQEFTFDSKEEFLKFLNEMYPKTFDGLEYDEIKIVEKEPDEAPPPAKIFQMTDEELQKAVKEQTKQEEDDMETSSLDSQNDESEEEE